MPNFRPQFAAIFLVAASAFLPSAVAEVSIYELRITNNTDRDLTFRLKDDHSKHVDLTHKKEIIPEFTIKPGASDIVGIRPDGHK
ncbi:MAG: hypothetical protein AAFZ74_17010, partial [Pseudomonadota bacterium]